MQKLINLSSQIPSLIMQIQKFFLKEKLKKLWGAVFAKFHAAHNEDPESMLEDLIAASRGAIKKLVNKGFSTAMQQR